MSKRRFYVTMTWDDWPEGGSFGTVVEAEDHAAAEEACRLEMAKSRAEEMYAGEEDYTPEYYLKHYAGEWFVVDCFDLDGFIKEHTKCPL